MKIKGIIKHHYAPELSEIVFSNGVHTRLEQFTDQRTLKTLPEYKKAIRTRLRRKRNNYFKLTYDYKTGDNIALTNQIKVFATRTAILEFMNHNQGIKKCYTPDGMVNKECKMINIKIISFYY